MTTNSTGQIRLHPSWLEPLRAEGVTCYVEIPVTAVDDHQVHELSDAGLRLKLRTGGTSIDAFSTEQQLAGPLVRCAAERQPAPNHTDVQPYRRRRPTTCQDARKPRQRIRGIHLQRHAFASLALYLTVTTRYHTLGPVVDPQQAGKLLKNQTVK